MRLSPQQLADIEKKGQVKVAVQSGIRAGKTSALKRWQALGRLPKDVMNKTEAEFSGWLEMQKFSGKIQDWKFHPMNIRLAKDTFYEVDFLVMESDNTMSIYEVKGGYTSDKGQLKIKLCAEVLPYFRMVKATKLPKGGGWKFEEF